MQQHDLDLSKYRTFIFDCDGVLLDSNHVKTTAFATVAESFGLDVVSQFVEYHRSNGGVSRQVKLRYLFEVLLKYRGEELEKRIAESLLVYREKVKAGLLGCAVAPRTTQLLKALPVDSKKYVVSGGAQDEVCWILEEKGLGRYFDGVFGNPADKMEIMSFIQAHRGLDKPALYFGDAPYDYEVAKRFELNFLFVVGMTDLSDWQSYANEKKLTTINFVGDLADEMRSM